MKEVSLPGASTSCKRIASDNQFKIGTALIVVGGLYLLHHRKLNSAVALVEDMSQAAVQDTMWSSFDEGVKYGIKLAKQSAEDAKEIGQYAFGAFDRSA